MLDTLFDGLKFIASVSFRAILALFRRTPKGEQGTIRMVGWCLPLADLSSHVA